MTALLVLGCIAAYIGCGLLPGRLIWARYRPNTEPIHCRDWLGCRKGNHDAACYRWSRDSLIDKGEAVVISVAGLLFWPVLLPVAVLAWLITRQPRERHEELQAKIARLERELRS